MTEKIIFDIKAIDGQDKSVSLESLKERAIYTAKIEVDQHYEQIVISFETDNISWFACNVYDQNQLRGQALHFIDQPVKSLFIGKKEEFNSATSISGAISPGIWLIELEVLTKAKADIHLSLEYELRKQGKIADDYLKNQIDILTNVTKKEGTEKWYKGDFHTHTTYSDGSMTRTRNIESAQKQALDFFVATDHTVVTHYWPKQEKVIVFPGTELTSPGGHANFLFIERSIFNGCKLEDMYSEAGINKIIEANQDNGLFSINHPFLSPCAWMLKETKLNLVTALEICNDPTYADNHEATERALSLWSILLNDGYRITGIGGSDSHLLPEETYSNQTVPSLIGDPGTYVYAKQLSATELKSGIEAGHVVISRSGFIDYKIRGEENLLPGDQVVVTQCNLEVKLEESNKVNFQWIVDGKVEKVDQADESHFQVNFTDEGYHWIRVDLYDLEGTFIGTTNPFYWGEIEPQLETWGDALNEWKKESNSI